MTKRPQRSGGPSPTGREDAHGPSGASSSRRLERSEERLTAEVVPEMVGRVSVHKRVDEVPEEIEVELRHDEVDIQRSPVDRPLQAGEQPVASHGDETVLLLIEERLEVRKVPWVVEEIRVRRRLEVETVRHADTVRKERIEITSEGDVNLDEPS